MSSIKIFLTIITIVAVVVPASASAEISFVEDFRVASAAPIDEIVGGVKNGVLLLAFILFGVAAFFSGVIGRPFRRIAEQNAYLADLSVSEEAKNAFEAKKRSFAVIYYEKRKSLNEIVRLTNMMLDEVHCPDMKKNLHKINNAVINLLGLVNDVLGISRTETDKPAEMSLEYDEASLLNDTYMGDKSGAVEKIAIPGVNTDRGLSIFDFDFETYLSTLRSYAANTGELINKLRDVTEETLPSYAIAMHDLRDASGSIGAEGIRKTAAKLESMAEAGDLNMVLALNEAFLEDAEDLVAEIQSWLKALDESSPRRRSYAPNPALLASLRQSCEKYDIDGIDKAMDELESAHYDADGSLVTWLREKIDEMEFSEVTKRLSEYKEEL